jgi:RNA polymerase sigma-70 factor (ECF subfamily)
VDEARLIEEVVAGRPEAERALYEAHVDRVYRLAHRMLGEAHAAEDLTQEVFVRIFDRIHTFRGDASLATWIHRVAVTTALNALRAGKGRRTHEMAVEDTGPFDRGIPAGDVALRLRIERAVDALSVGMRTVFLLHDVEGFKHHEIARVLDVPVGTSKARLSRARAELRRQLEGIGRPLASEEG